MSADPVTPEQLVWAIGGLLSRHAWMDVLGANSNILDLEISRDPSNKQSFRLTITEEPS